MILKGILDSSLGGFTCLRGYAPLGDLARCSSANDSYQRNLIATHRKDITAFLSEADFLFFPEVVLSAALELGGDKERRFFDMVGKGAGTLESGNGVKLRLAKVSPSSKALEGETSITIGALEIDEEMLALGAVQLFRIDGNHRLSAVKDENGKEIQKFSVMKTPFCLVLFPIGDQAGRFEKAVFHNINAKQIPLTSEQNLKNILDDDKLFPDDKLLSSPSFGPKYWLARKLRYRLDLGYLVGIANTFRDPEGNELLRTTLLELADFLIAGNHTPAIEANSETVERIVEIAKDINTTYLAHEGLRNGHCRGLFIVFIHYALANNGAQREGFERWAVDDQLFHVTEIKPQSLRAVYESREQAKEKTIFVSMAFSQPTSDQTYEAIKAAVDRYNEKYHETIELREIRIDKLNKGHSFPIDTEILKQIAETGLLIADLSYGNANVYHEVGCLMGLNAGRGKPQENFILIADQGTRKEELQKDIGFNIAAWQQIRFKGTLELSNRLFESLEIKYGKVRPKLR